ncbi:MAG: VWD domain-containing protein, partial [Verrucomicrobiales bacterium]|nr:VWD domain-containing protein [Verrucomicrobiales bacterium]
NTNGTGGNTNGSAGGKGTNTNGNGGGKGNTNGKGSGQRSKGKGSGKSGGTGGPPGGGDAPAGGMGEPHYLTRDGTPFSSQAVGEFVLVDNASRQTIQVRTQPWRDSKRASAITAMAFQVGGNRVEVRVDGTVLIDGHEAPAGAMIQGDLANGGAVGVWRRVDVLVGAVVVWPDFSICWITPRESWLDFALQFASPDKAQRGLLGSNDGDPSNDLTSRDGSIASALKEDEIAKFVDSWRVTKEGSLFTYAPGESTTTYTQRDFPKDKSPAIITPEIDAACAHLPEGPLRQFAQTDLALTGHQAFLDSYTAFHRRAAGIAAFSAQSAQDKPFQLPKMEQGQSGGLDEDNRKKATALDASATLDETLKEGESKVYRIELPADRAPGFGVLSQELDLVHYTAGMAGYQFFTADGKELGQPEAPGRDSPMRKFPEGTLYLKIWGPGRIHIRLN